MASTISAVSPTGQPISHNTPVDSNVPTHVASLWAAGYTDITVKSDMGRSGASGGNYGGGCNEG